MDQSTAIGYAIVLLAQQREQDTHYDTRTLVTVGRRTRWQRIVRSPRVPAGPDPLTAEVPW